MRELILDAYIRGDLQTIQNYIVRPSSDNVKIGLVWNPGATDQEVELHIMIDGVREHFKRDKNGRIFTEE